MLLKLLFAIAVVLTLFWLYRWLKRTPAAQRTQKVLSLLLGFVALLLIGLAVTGRLHWLLGLLAGLIPFAQRLLGLLRNVQLFKNILAQLRGVGGARPTTTGQQSIMESRYLRIVVDHASGALTGTVLAGRYRGNPLAALDLAALLELLAECRIDDREAAQLLEVYLDRRHGPSWRGTAHTESRATPPHNSGTLTVDEAHSILGVEKGATAAEIKMAHKRLMQKMHPDRGGSNYLAAKINQAKDLLLSRLR